MGEPCRVAVRARRGVRDLRFRELPVGRRGTSSGSSSSDRRTYALKEEPLDVARTEFDVLRHLEALGLPAVTAVGLARGARSRERDPRHRVSGLLDPVPAPAHAVPAGPRAVPRPAAGRHGLAARRPPSGGVYWGDCSLANTLFRRDGDKIQAFLVDAETSEIHHRCPTANARTTSTSSSRTSPSAWPTSGPCRAARMPSEDAVEAAETVRPLRGDVGRAPPRARAVPRRSARGPRPDPPPQRARLRGRRDHPGAGRRRRAPSDSRSPSPTAGSTPGSSSA